MIFFLLANFQRFIYKGPKRRWLAVYGLPLEVWVDIFSFPWISRQEFGRIVDKIGNFKFAEHAQFFLHEWGKQTLDMEWVCFDKKGLYKYANNRSNKRLYLDVPQTPLPTNINKFLGYIEISHFDATTLDFLGKIRPLLTNVDLYIHALPKYLHLVNLRTILTALAPLVDGIHTLDCVDFALPMAKHLFPDKFAKLKMLEISLEYKREMQKVPLNTFMEWLTQPNASTGDDGPRLCEFRRFYGGKFYKQILRAIREQFLAAKTPCTFAVSFFGAQKIDFRKASNSIGEQLDGGWTLTGSSFQITRHQANCGTQLWPWTSRANTKRSRGQIAIYNPTICSMDAAQIGVPEADGEEEEVQQPSCSSKQA